MGIEEVGKGGEKGVVEKWEAVSRDGEVEDGGGGKEALRGGFTSRELGTEWGDQREWRG